jgi:hypothetical protein
MTWGAKKNVSHALRVVQVARLKEHIIMVEDTRELVREAHVYEFCGDDLDEYGARLGKVITIH